MDYSDKQNRNKKIAIIVVVVVIFAIIVASFLLIGRNNADKSGTEEPYGVIYENPGLVSESMGGSLFGMVAGNIESVVMNSDEIAMAPSGSSDGDESSLFKANIDNSGYSKSVYFPYSTYKFGFSLDDGRQYDVNVAGNLPGYYGVLISRNIPRQDVPKLFIVFLKNETQGGYNRKMVIQNIEKWAKTIAPGGFYLTTENIF